MNDDAKKLLVKYATARIDIKNIGNKNNYIQIINDNPHMKVSQPGWFSNSEGVGTIIESNEGILKLLIKFIGGGTFKLWLRGIDFRDKQNNRFPIYIDFTTLEINGEKIFEHNMSVCHDLPYVYEKPVVDGEIITLTLKWLPFNEFSEYDPKLHSNKLVKTLKKQLSEREKQMNSIPQLSGTTLGRSALGGKIIYRNWLSLHPPGRTLLKDFDNSYDFVWFSRYLNHKFPDRDFKINMFGVFQDHENLTYPLEGKKVLYSPEDLNYRFLEMKRLFNKYALDHVDFAMGFDLINHEKYLRFPNWLTLNFSPFITAEEIENKINIWNSSSFEKTKNVVSVASHDHWGTRTMISQDIERIVRIDHAGKWNNNTSELHTKYNNNKSEYLKRYKFNLCPENVIDTAYVTEKIVDAIKSDCIPLYAGGREYFEPKIINENAIIRWYDDGCITPDSFSNDETIQQYKFKYSPDYYKNLDSIELFNNILNDEKTYDEFKDQNKLQYSSAKYIIKIFDDLEKHFERIICQ